MDKFVKLSNKGYLELLDFNMYLVVIICFNFIRNKELRLI
jgi:hypothetical protein